MFGVEPLATNTLAIGPHEIVLRLDDGYPYGTNSASVVVEVIPAGDALEMLAEMVTESSLSAQRQHDLLVTILSADTAANRGLIGVAIKNLQAFQYKLQAQVAPFDSELASNLTAAAQSIIEALQIGYKPDRGWRQTDST